MKDAWTGERVEKTERRISRFLSDKGSLMQHILLLSKMHKDAADVNDILSFWHNISLYGG